ncbi:MAG TPA: DUF2845 domain-containing protein [Steroidobacteraceae bacterium]|nr:DUF2845 domain-containing protein [Steroidobacteraceae bacterium]
MRVLVSAALAALLLALALPAAADGLRCGSKLMTTGDPRSKVRQFCGEPTDIQTRSILRRPTFNFGGRILSYGDGYVEIPVEIWTYNFGPYKLMREIRFVDGRIENIETLGYGYHSAPAASAEDDSARRDTYR